MFFSFQGGWLRIGRVVTTSNNIQSYKLPLSLNVGDLNRAATANFLLSDDKFQTLKSQINFHEFRVYCTKPYHGRVNHALFTDQNTPQSKALFDYVMGAGNLPKNLCGALNYLPNDNSLTKSLDCNNLRPSSGVLSQRLYKFIWYVNGKTHLTVGSKTSMYCDDYNSGTTGYNNYGTWYWYVR